MVHGFHITKVNIQQTNVQHLEIQKQLHILKIYLLHIFDTL